MSAHGTALDQPPTLARPPRAVPFRLCCRLLANGPAVWGSVVFGLVCLVAVPLALGMDPLGSLRLALDRREAPGRVVAERDTNYEENGTRVRRHDYTFRLPDGTVLRGHSYSAGHKYLNVPTAPAFRTPSAGRASPSNTTRYTPRPTASMGHRRTPYRMCSRSCSSSRSVPWRSLFSA